MTAFYSNFVNLVKRQDERTSRSTVLKLLSRNLLLLLVLLWTPFILLQTWNLQHSCSPLINWGGDRCPIERIEIAPQDFSLKVGESRYLKVGIKIKSDIKDKSSVDRSVVWRSSSEKVATVDSQGRVTAITPGFVFLIILM